MAVGGRRWVAVGAASALIVGTLPVFLLLRGGPPSALQGAGTLTAMGGQAISTTRASTKMCARSDGGLVQLANDTPCVDSLGLYVENGATNIALQSGALQTTPWAGFTTSAKSSDTFALWKMDDDAGTSADVTGNHNLTAFGGTPLSVPGEVGTGRTTTTSTCFTSSALSLSDAAVFNSGAWTISFWVNPFSDATGETLYINGPNLGSQAAQIATVAIQYDAVNKRFFMYSYVGVGVWTRVDFGAVNSVPASTWTLFTLTRTAPASQGASAIWSPYYNNAAVTPAFNSQSGGGSQAGTYTSTTYTNVTPTIASDNTYVIGIGGYKDVSNTFPHLHAIYDDVRFFNAVLTPTEVANLYAAGGTSITATANAGGARDGTTTAIRLDYPAVTSRQQSTWNQAFTGTADIYTAAVDVKAVSGTPTLYLSLNNGSTYYRSTCTPSSTSLTRCSVTSSVALTAATWNFQVGVDTADSSQAAQGAQSVYVSGAQIETSSVPTSYIPTAASTGARSGELVLTGAVSLPGTTYSLSGDFTPQGFGSASGDIININTDSGEEIYAKLNATGGANTMDCGALAGGTFATTTTATFTSGVTSHFSCSYDGVNLVACVGGSCISAAKAFTRSVLPYTRAFLMNDTLLTGRPTVPGHLSNLCVAATPSGCR